MGHANSIGLRRTLLLGVWLGCALAAPVQRAMAQNQEAELAKKLSNPVADLISVPFKLDYDMGIKTAPMDAWRGTYVVQPVIPISLDTDWNVISRTILPYVDMQSIPGNGNSGMGDTLQSLFLSPKAASSGGWIWGAGPAMSLPTGNSMFGSGRWSFGPTAVLLKQSNGWTYGALVNQLWSVGANSHRADVNTAFVQPFLTYTTDTHTTFGLNTETTIDWRTSQATVPINATVSQLTMIEGHPVNFQLGGRFYATRPTGGPTWGLRFQVTLLFPK